MLTLRFDLRHAPLDLLLDVNIDWREMSRAHGQAAVKLVRVTVRFVLFKG